MLLSKALKKQQDNEDRKNEIIIEGLENKIKDLEASLEKKDFLLQAVEGSLAKAQSQITKLSEELDNAQTIFNKKSECFDQETKELQARAEAKAEKNTKIHESMKDLRNKCTDYATRFVNWLKGIFNSVGATSEEIAPSAEDIPKAFEHFENEVEALDEVITGHRDFCALLASRGTAAVFLKAGCTHAKMINMPTFGLSTSDLVDIPAEAQSIINKFSTQIWARGGRELAGDEARKLLNSVWNFYVCLFTLVYLY
jgi:exonuclease VII large subunit